MRTLGDIRELRDGIWWLVRLRIVATAGVVIATYTTKRYLGLDIYTPGLYAVSAFLFLYNLLCAFLLQRIEIESVWPTRILANSQISIDFLCLTILLHFSGGIENPFVFYYVFHTIICAILLTRLEAAIQTFVAIALFSGMVLSEQRGLIRHWELGIEPGFRSHEVPVYSAGVSFVLVSTLILALYMTISVSERSRRKNIEISRIRERLSRTELPRSEEEILREEKLSSLGKMAAGIAHEINNPLTVILTNLELALDDLESGNPTHETLEIAREEVIRCRGIIEQLLTFSRGRETGRQICDAARLLNDSIALIQNYASLNRVRIGLSVPRERALIRINQNQMKQVLVNVMMNGIQAMPEGGELKVELLEPDGRFVEFAVEDNGVGISKSALSKIFDPFFTTKKTGRGTGLGLAVSHRLVESHNGVIDIQSAEGQGTRVTIRLPRGQ